VQLQKRDITETDSPTLGTGTSYIKEMPLRMKLNVCLHKTSTFTCTALNWELQKPR